MQPEKMTLRERLQLAEELLASAPHPDRARLDAELLALSLLSQTRSWLLANRNQPWPASLESAYTQALARRSRGEPVQYILGHTEFFGLPFSVAPGVLIPRPETEHLVEEVIRLAAGSPKPRIADIGTGSGAIAVALAHALPAARLWATDLSPEALQIARLNAPRNSVADRITFLAGDLLTPLTGQQFDIIASNPPYIPLTDHDSLSVEVRSFEPHSALFAGEDGLGIYRRLIPDSRALLTSGGWLVMEIGYGQQQAIKTLLETSRYTKIHFVPDYQGIPRVAVAQVN
jgi:release factor glutamine methyltransferase